MNNRLPLDRSATGFDWTISGNDTNRFVPSNWNLTGAQIGKPMSQKTKIYTYIGRFFILGGGVKVVEHGKKRFEFGLGPSPMLMQASRTMKTFVYVWPVTFMYE